MGLFEALKVVLGREHIDDLPEQRHDHSSFLSWLFAAEPLPPEDAPPPAGRRSFLSQLFAGEELPRDHDQSPATPGDNGRKRG
jgi:hypothetical protein